MRDREMAQIKSPMEMTRPMIAMSLAFSSRERVEAGGGTIDMTVWGAWAEESGGRGDAKP